MGWPDAGKWVGRGREEEEEWAAVLDWAEVLDFFSPFYFLFLFKLNSNYLNSNEV
jgi:hypothetical protein